MQTLLIGFVFVVAYFFLGSILLLFPLLSCVKTHINAFSSVLQPLGESCHLQLASNKYKILFYLQKLVDTLQMLFSAGFVRYTF